MIVDLITGTREWIIPCVFFGSMLAAGEAGFRFGRSAQSRTAERVKAQMSVVEAWKHSACRTNSGLWRLTMHRKTQIQ